MLGWWRGGYDGGGGDGGRLYVPVVFLPYQAQPLPYTDTHRPSPAFWLGRKSKGAHLSNKFPHLFLVLLSLLLPRSLQPHPPPMSGQPSTKKDEPQTKYLITSCTGVLLTKVRPLEPVKIQNTVCLGITSDLGEAMGAMPPAHMYNPNVDENIANPSSKNIFNVGYSLLARKINTADPSAEPEMVSLPSGVGIVYIVSRKENAVVRPAETAPKGQNSARSYQDFLKSQQLQQQQQQAQQQHQQPQQQQFSQKQQPPQPPPSILGDDPVNKLGTLAMEAGELLAESAGRAAHNSYAFWGMIGATLSDDFPGRMVASGKRVVNRAGPTAEGISNTSKKIFKSKSPWKLWDDHDGEDGK